MEGKGSAMKKPWKERLEFIITCIVGISKQEYVSVKSKCLNSEDGTFCRPKKFWFLTVVADVSWAQ